MCDYICLCLPSIQQCISVKQWKNKNQAEGKTNLSGGGGDQETRTSSWWWWWRQRNQNVFVVVVVADEMDRPQERQWNGENERGMTRT